MPLNKQVHEYARVQLPSGQFANRLVHFRPYLSFTERGHPTLYIQGGDVYQESGDAIPEDEWPTWFLEQVERTDLEAKRVVGWKRGMPEPPEDQIARLLREKAELEARLTDNIDDAVAPSDEAKSAVEDVPSLTCGAGEPQTRGRKGRF